VRRAYATLAVSGITLIALLAMAVWLPVPYVRMAPGPTFNVIGDVNDQAVIVITGTESFPTSGELDMTTVSESGGPRGGLTFIQAMGAWFAESDAVVPSSLLYPEDVTGEDLRRRNAALFSTSESNAVAAALNYLGLPLDSQVVATAVFEDSPAEEFFLPKDRILTLDGVQIKEPTDVSETIRSKPIGTTFRFEVSREVEGSITQESFDVVSGANPDDPQVPYIGIGLGTYFAPANFDIALTVKDVGGPSAGLIFALGIVDKLTPGELTGGKAIAGSGTITPDGVVGSIGGVRQKMAGAKREGVGLFLLPERNCREAVGHIPEGLDAVPVATIAEAAGVIADWVAGKPVEGCPVSAAPGS
jgi:Lon-like protease